MHSRSFCFCTPVSQGDRRRIGLLLNSSTGLKILQSYLPGLPGSIDGEVEHHPK